MHTFALHQKKYYHVTHTYGCVVGCAAKPVNTVDYAQSSEEIRHDEKLLLQRLTSFEPQNIVMLNQVHGDTIIQIDQPPEKDVPYFADADAMITSLSSVCAVIRTADCVPVFVYDKENHIVGSAHSGWRGTAKNISGKMVQLMCTKYGSLPRDLYAYILPSIGPESYQVQEDVARYFPDDVIERDTGLYLNLWQTITRSLMAENISAENIFNTGECTLIGDETFFSHRAGDKGRNLNFSFLV